jgi:hypothetical protein
LVRTRSWYHRQSKGLRRGGLSSEVEVIGVLPVIYYSRIRWSELFQSSKRVLYFLHELTVSAVFASFPRTLLRDEY